MGGLYDASLAVCWSIVDNDSGDVLHQPRLLSMYTTNSNQQRAQIQSLERIRCLDRIGRETFMAHDGEMVEFCVKGKLVKKIVLPRRAVQNSPLGSRPSRPYTP